MLQADAKAHKATYERELAALQAELDRRGGATAELATRADGLEKQLQEAADALAALAQNNTTLVQEKAAAEQAAAAARAEAQREATAVQVSARRNGGCTCTMPLS